MCYCEILLFSIAGPIQYPRGVQTMVCRPQQLNSRGCVKTSANRCPLTSSYRRHLRRRSRRRNVNHQPKPVKRKTGGEAESTVQLYVCLICLPHLGIPIEIPKIVCTIIIQISSYSKLCKMHSVNYKYSDINFLMVKYILSNTGAKVLIYFAILMR